MEVLILQVFVSLMLVVSSVVLFAKSVRGRDYEHADRLALFPIADDDAVSATERRSRLGRESSSAALLEDQTETRKKSHGSNR